MRIKRNNISSTKVKLIVEADAVDMEPIKRHVLTHFRNQVQIQGFRSGSAPLALVEKNVDRRLLLDEFLEHALNQFYTKAVVHFDLKPVGQPQVELKKFVPFSELLFEVETEAIGKIILPDYKKIKLDKKTATITAKEVSEAIKSLQYRIAKRKAVKRAARKNDEVIVDFYGRDKNGKLIAEASAKDYPIIIGRQNLILEFEKHLIGVIAGQRKKFNVKFPSDYTPSFLSGKEVKFEVIVKEVYELNLPKADDRFARQIGPFKTLTALKADIKKQLKIEKQQQLDRDYQNRIISEIVHRSSVEIPETMIDEDVMRLEEDEKRDLTYRGKSWQEHLSEEGISQEQHRQKQRPRAKERIKASLVLGEIAEKEKITVSTDEVEARLKLLKNQYGDEIMRAELEKPQARREIHARLLTEKTIAKIVEITSR